MGRQRLCPFHPVAQRIQGPEAAVPVLSQVQKVTWGSVPERSVLVRAGGM